MKKIINLSFVLLGLILIGCDAEPLVFDSVNGQTLYSFSKTSTTVDVCEPTTKLTIESTTKSNQDRTVSLSVLPDATTALPEMYTLPNSITIPAGEYTGSVEVSVDFTEVEPGTSNTVAIEYNVSESNAVTEREVINVNFDGACTENLLQINIEFDSWPEEIYWRIQNSGGVTVAASSPTPAYGAYSGLTGGIVIEECLPSGEYTFTIFDQYGDGAGAYSLGLAECSGTTELYSSDGSYGGGENVTLVLE